MTYDSNNQLLAKTDGSGRRTFYQYSSHGDLLSVSNPDLKEADSRKYDQYGNAIEASPTVLGTHNLLSNGSMEIPGTGGALLANWTRVPGAAAVVQNSSWDPHGNYSLKISSSTPTTDWFYQSVSGVNTGDKLTLRIDLKLSNVQYSGSYGGAIIELNYGNGYYEYLNNCGSGTAPLVLTSQAASSSVTVYVGLYSASGTVWIDGVQLVDAGPSGLGYILSGFNSVENNGFENGMANWTGTGATTNGAAWEGASSLELQAAGTAYQDVPTYGGEQLTFSGMIKTDGISGNGAYYKIDYYDTSNNFIPGASVQTSYVTGTQDWTRLSATATTPSNASHARIQCILDGSGDTFFDDVKLIPRISQKYAYDSSGNYMVTSEDALKNQNQYIYDQNVGNELSFTDPLNRTASYGYDPLNRLTQVTDPSSHNSSYYYDPVSNLTYTHDPGSSPYGTFYYYNNANQLTKLTNPLGQSTTYNYDHSGNLIEVSLPNGLKEDLFYDNANRLGKVALDGGKYFGYLYDGADEPTLVIDQDGKSYSFSYDGAHRLTGSTDPLGYVLSYQWDKSSNLVLFSGSDYGNLQYNYGSDNRLLSVSLPDGSSIYYDCDENGCVFQIRYPGDYNYRRLVYAPNGWLTQIQDHGFPGQYFYTYSYNNDGTISGYTSRAGAESFSYDADDRLTNWSFVPSSGNSVQESYGYDAAGNLLNKGSKTFTYNCANEITNTGFTYDAAGNLTSDGNLKYTYNALDQLVQVNKVSDNSLVATYTYNHDGSRRSKTINGQTTNYNWDASSNLVRESAPGGINYYYYTPSGNLIGFKKGGTTYIAHDNQRGDIESVTTESGSIVAQYHYDPWGNQVSASGSVTMPFGYAGYYFDSETGLYYLKSRYYSPALGRFITRDSYGNISCTNPQTLDLYSYCCNDPVNRTDPNGNWMAGDENIDFTDTEKADIAYYGDMYNASTTAAEREHWHDLANNVRTEAMMNEAQSWVMGIAGGGDAEVAESAAKTVGIEASDAIGPVVQNIKSYLGDNATLIKNKADDIVIKSEDGLRRIRVDFNKYIGHDLPHLHIDRLVNNAWKTIRAFPKGW